MEPFRLDIFLLGCLGGLLPDVLRFVKSRHGKMAKFYSYKSFWVGLFLLIGLGGLSAWLGGATEKLDALAFGFAAPEILSKLLSDHSPTPPGAVDRGGAEFSLRRWWKG